MTVMLTTEFGHPIYVAPIKGLVIQLTDKIEEAEIWDEKADQTKLEFHKAITGYNLTFETIENK